MVDYFLQALEPTYLGHLETEICKSYNKVVKMGAMVEQGLKYDKIMSYSAIKETIQAIQIGRWVCWERRRKKRLQQSKPERRLDKSPSSYYQPRPHYQNYPYTPYSPPQHYYPPSDPHFFCSRCSNLYLTSGSCAMACTSSPKGMATSTKHISTPKGLTKSFGI